MTIFEMSKEDFAKVPRVNGYACCDFDSIVIIPLNELHESGFCRMEFVVADEAGIPICAFGGCQDVIHLNGLLGIGDKQINETKDKATGRLLVDPVAWSIDCLPCGYLRLFAKNQNDSGNGQNNLTANGICISDLDVLCR